MQEAKSDVWNQNANQGDNPEVFGTNPTGDTKLESYYLKSATWLIALLYLLSLFSFAGVVLVLL